MCSQIDHYSSLLILRKMSDDRQIFPVDKQGTIIVSETPDSSSSSSHRQISPQAATDEREREADDQLPEEIKDEAVKPTVSDRRDDLDEGYETPTSSDHRIPPITECPPPPMKPRPPPPSKLLKRKLSPPSRSIQLEVESIFSPIADDDAQQHKSKRARTADDRD